MQELLAVALGGSIGAVSRYKVQPQKVDKSASILQRVNFSRNKNIESSITKTGAVYKSSTAIEIELLSIERK